MTRSAKASPLPRPRRPALGAGAFPGRSQRGIAMMEALLTLFIVLVGVLGLAAVQTRMAQANTESYQRAQALILMQDMVDRLNMNRQIADCLAFTTDSVNGAPYVGQNPADAGHAAIASLACGAGAGGTGVAAVDALAAIELNSWDGALQGVAETKAGASVGAMLGARGCVSASNDALGNRIYKVEVSWQGQSSGFAPSSSCGKNLYGSENLRRVVWTTVQFASIR